MKISINLSIVLVIALVAWFTFQPGVTILYPYQRTYGFITIYADKPLDLRSDAILTKAQSLLDTSELRRFETHETVFVSDARWKAAFVHPSALTAFAISTPLSNHVFISQGKIETNQAFAGEEGIGPRSLSGVIAHEITHNLIRRHLGKFKVCVR